jgi:two-component system cell cycle response regulator
MSEYIDTIIHRGKQYSDKDFEKKVPSLTYLGGGQVGRRIMLADDRITFGRSPKATIMLRDTHVSRLHIAIAFDPDRNGYRIQDLGSSNGTILNGTRISEAILKNADKILIGETMLRFGWSDAFDLKYQTEIDNLMNIDELTGLVVKRRFDEELDRYIAVAKSQGKGLAMIMMDLDGVKQINDTHGHAFGAYTIAETGALIKAIIDQKGLASRFGGDEFMAFLPNVKAEAARQIAEQIRVRVETHPYEKNGISLKPTICLGISNLKADDSMTALFNRADEALYLSKRTGRNKVSVSD